LLNILTVVSQEDNAKINQEVTKKELYEALFQLHLDKAPCLDGFNTHFYQKCWHTIKKDLLRMIHYVQKSIKLGANTNSSFLALIPKDSNPSSSLDSDPYPYAMSHTNSSLKSLPTVSNLYSISLSHQTKVDL